MRKELKENAKKTMKGNMAKTWLMLILTGLVASIVSGIFDLINGAAGWTVTETKTILGQTVENQTVSTIPGLFESLIIVVVGFYASVVLYKFILSVIRGKELSITECFKAPFKNIWAVIIAGLLIEIFITLGCIFLIIPGIIVGIGFTFFTSVLADNPELTGWEIVKKSWEITKGHKGEIFVLGLSFIPWILLCILIIPIIYVIPYMEYTFQLYYEKIK